MITFHRGMAKDPVHSPHDRFFKVVFRRQELARDLLHTFFPLKLAETILWDTLEIYATEAIDEALSERHHDLVFKVRLRSLREVYLYPILEHQSDIQRWMVFRMQDYYNRLSWHLAKETKRGERVPLVTPVVLHQGASQWTAAQSLSEVIDIPEDATVLHESAPRFRYLLIDLAESDESWPQTPEVRVAVGLMKSVAAKRGLAWIEQHLGEVEASLNPDDGSSLVTSMLCYLAENESQVMEKLAAMEPVVQNKHMHETVLTSAEQLRKEGRKEGRVEGRKEGRVEGLVRAIVAYLDARFPMDESWRRRLEGLDERALQKLGVEFPNIASAEQLEAWLRDHASKDK